MIVVIAAAEGVGLIGHREIEMITTTLEERGSSLNHQEVHIVEEKMIIE